MKRHSWIALFRDLVHFMPGHSPKEWSDLNAVEPNRPTVVLVSGFGATHRTLSVMRKRLERDGFNVLILSLDWQTLSDCVRGLYRMAEKLSTIILQLRKQGGQNRSKVFVVAHSAGGLVARYYIQQLGGSHYCDGLVTLATPHRGTWIAGAGFFTHLILKGRVLFQLLPVSPFVKSLNQASFPRKFPMLSISSPQDFLCPIAATQLPGKLTAENEVESISIPRLSHSAFLLSKRNYALVKYFLDSKKESVRCAVGRYPLTFGKSQK